MDRGRTCSCSDEWHYHHDHCAAKIQSHEEQLTTKDAEIAQLREALTDLVVMLEASGCKDRLVDQAIEALNN